MNRDAKERRRNIELMRKGCLKFVFVSPERFVIQEFRDALDRIRKEGIVHFAFVVIDEAHCVSEWGHDFRTAYLRLGKNARKFCYTLQKELPLLALTGTASLDVLDDVTVELDYENSDIITVYPDSMKRDNLKYSVVPIDPMLDIPPGAALTAFLIREAVGNAKLASLPAILGRITRDLANVEATNFLTDNNGSGLIFCPHVGGLHGAEKVQATLRSEFTSIQNTFGIFHGSPDEEGTPKGFDPIKAQDAFKNAHQKYSPALKRLEWGLTSPTSASPFIITCPPPLNPSIRKREGQEETATKHSAGCSMPEPPCQGKRPKALTTP